MIDYTYEDLFKQDSVDKQVTIEFEDGETITNTDIYQEEMSITESISSSTDIEFGNCEASVIKFKIANSFTSHIGQTVKVSVVLDGNTDEPFIYGTYTVTSDKPTADRIYREIEAYDRLYEIINSDVADWYEELLPDTTSTCTLLEFRTSFFNYFGVEQEDVSLINDDMVVEKTLSSTVLSGKDVLKNILSINGCFGHINRENKFTYVFFGTTAIDLTDYYSDCTYEDYVTETIDCIQIRQDTDDSGVTYGSGDNLYVIEGNFLVYGKDTEDLTAIASNLYSLIANVSYRPATVTAKGNPCIEVGDMITLTTKYETITTFVLQRTLKGIQALTDTYTATGSEEFSTEVNSVTSTVNQLAGKTQSLTLSLEETKSEMTSITTTQEGEIETLQSQITQTYTDISLTVNNGETSSGITITGTKTDGSTDTSSGTITMSGLVTFTDLSTSGSTTINGDNITTGTITADIGTIGDWYINNGTIASSETITVDNDEGGIMFGNPNFGELVYDSRYCCLIAKNDDGDVTLAISPSRLYIDNGEVAIRTGGMGIHFKSNLYDTYFRESTQGTLIMYSSASSGKMTISFTDQFVEIDNMYLYVDNGIYMGNGKYLYGQNTSSTNCIICGMNSSNQYLFGTTSYATYLRGSTVYVQGAMSCNSTLTTSGAITSGASLILNSSSSYGHINKYSDSTNGDGIMMWVQGSAAFALTTVSTSNTTPRIWTNYMGHFQPPVTSTYNIGNSSYRYSTIYSVNSLNTSSDRNDKHDIEDFTETQETLFEKLKPVTFMRNDGDRTHFGFISQDVFESMEEIGMTDMDFAGYCRDVKSEHKQVETGELDDEGNPLIEEIDEPILDEDGNEQYTYSLRYEEFIALNTHMIQKYHADETEEIETLKETIAELQSENETLKSEIAQIKEALGLS